MAKFTLPVSIYCGIIFEVFYMSLDVAFCEVYSVVIYKIFGFIFAKKTTTVCIINTKLKIMSHWLLFLLENLEDKEYHY